jgi:glucose-1-phosphate thymidylyltransferase
VLEGAVIADLANRIEDNLIGRGVHIYRAPKKPSAYRFMLGDNSEVGIRW